MACQIHQGLARSGPGYEQNRSKQMQICTEAVVLGSSPEDLVVRCRETASVCESSGTQPMFPFILFALNMITSWLLLLIGGDLTRMLGGRLARESLAGGLRYFRFVSYCARWCFAQSQGTPFP